MNCTKIYEWSKASSCYCGIVGENNQRTVWDTNRVDFFIIYNIKGRIRVKRNGVITPYLWLWFICLLLLTLTGMKQEYTFSPFLLFEFPLSHLKRGCKFSFEFSISESRITHCLKYCFQMLLGTFPRAFEKNKLSNIWRGEGGKRSASCAIRKQSIEGRHKFPSV